MTPLHNIVADDLFARLDQMTIDILAELNNTNEAITGHREEIEKRRTDGENRKRAIKSFTTSLMHFLGEQKTTLIKMVVAFDQDESQRR